MHDPAAAASSQGTLAKARTGKVANPRIAGGTAVKVAPVAGSPSKPVRCSTTRMPAANRTVWAGRCPVVVSSMLTESIPTRAAPRSTSVRAPGFGEVWMDGITVPVGAPVPVPASSQQDGCTLDVHVGKRAGADRSVATVYDHCGEQGAVFERKASQVVAVAEAVRRRVEIGAGVGNHAHPADRELGTGCVVACGGVEAEVFTDFWSWQPGVGDHLMLDDVAEVEQSHDPIITAR